MLTERERKVLETLCDNSPEVYTSKDLALLMNVSSRTIKNDLEQINNELEKENLEVNSARGKGYWLDIETKTKLMQTVGSTLFKNIDVNNKEIIEYLLFKKEFIPVYEIAEHFFYSETTLLNKIPDINNDLKKYNLNITREPRRGIKLIGKEKDQRIMHAEILKNKNITSDGLFFSEEIENDQLYKDFNEIQSLLTEFQRKNNISLSDIAQAGLAIDIITTINRIRTDGNLQLSKEEIDELKQHREWYYALNLSDLLEKKYDVEFSEAEISFLNIHLLSANLSNDELPKTIEEISEKVDQNLLLKIVEWIEEIDKKFHTNLHEDMKFLSSLALHVRPMLKRLQHGISLTNPWIKDLQENHGKAYEMSVSLASKIQKDSRYSITPHEIAYIAMHIGGALERSNVDEKINVFIVCSSGIGTSTFLKNRLKKIYPRFNIVKTLPAYSEELKKLEDEIIISTVSVDFKANNLIQVSPMLTDHDQEKINKFLNNKNYDFNHYFDENLFESDLKIESKNEILEKAHELLYEYGYVKEDYLNDLIEREKLAPTEIGNLIAIPHAFSENVIDTGVCVFLLDEPIQWEMTSVQIIFAFSIEARKAEDISELIDRISAFRDDFSLINETINSKDFNEFKDNFEKIKL